MKKIYEIPIKKRHKGTKPALECCNRGAQSLKNLITLFSSPVLCLCAFCLCVFFLSQASYAETYKYLDQEGVMHFTDYPPPTIVNNTKNYISPVKNQGNQPDNSNLYNINNNRSNFDQLSDIQYTHIIKLSAEKYGLDQNLIKAVIKAESDFDPYVISKKGAMGLMQLIPDTAKRYNVKNPFDPNQNIEGGVKYLNDLFEMFDGNINYILAAYNSGENTVIKYNGIPPYKETKDYVKKVTMYYNEYKKSYKDDDYNNKNNSSHNIIYTSAESNKIFKVVTKDGTVIFTDFPYSSYLNRSSVEGVYSISE